MFHSKPFILGFPMEPPLEAPWFSPRERNAPRMWSVYVASSTATPRKRHRSSLHKTGPERRSTLGKQTKRCGKPYEKYCFLE